MDTTTSVISLCSGIGGLDLGLKLAIPDSRTECYVEIEAPSINVLVSRMEEGALDPAPIWTDLTSFSGVEWRGLVDGIIGGYPCQPFSVAGRQRGSEDERHLWPHIARIIREVQPGWAFFENVPNHLNIGYREVREELEGMGYLVTQDLFSAEDVGASHLRERLFILAYRPGVRLPIRCTAETPVLGQEGFQSHARRAGSWHSSMAYSHSSRLEGRCVCGRGCPEQWPAGPCSCEGFPDAFPPGPDALDRWAGLLEQDLALAPALSEEEVERDVRRVADGVAPWMDRIRACGAGVVPLVAAYAFCHLAKDFEL